MSETKQATASELSPSAAMLQMIAGFRISRAIYVAGTLGLADLLNEGPKSSEEFWRRQLIRTRRRSTE
jgi:hypothetical protein